MKRMHWFALLGLPGVGLAAALLGQAVWGQQDKKAPAPLSLKVLKPTTDPLAALPKAPDLPLAPLPELMPTGLLEATQISGPAAPLTPPSIPSMPQLPKREQASKDSANAITAIVPPGRQQPSASIEWHGPATVRVNQPLPCQIIVRNTATSSLGNVVVRHRLNPGVTCKASEPTATFDSGEWTWNLGTLAPNESRRIDLVLVAQARGTLDTHASVTFTALAGHQVQVREPMLAVKMRGPAQVVAGENVTLLFAVSNPGDGISEAVKVKALLPDGLEHSRGKMIEFDVGNLAPKELRTMQVVCVAKGSGVQKCNVVATGEGNLNAQDAGQVEILMPQLDVAMSGPKLRYVDRHAVYVVKVTNPGSAPASNVEVQEVIPAGFKFHQASHGGQFSLTSRVVSWKLGDLPPGQSKEIAVDLVPVEAGEHRLVANVKAMRGLKSEAEVRTLVEGLPSLFIDVGHLDDPIEVGAETAFEIRLVNTGSKTETNVQIVCTLPEQLEFRGAKCSATLRYRHEGRELIFEPLPRLAPKADVIYRVQVRGIAAGDVRFRTKIRADGLKEPVLREESMRVYSDELPIRPSPGGLTPPEVPVPMKPGSVPAPLAPLPESLPVPSGPSPVILLPTPAPVPPLPVAPLPAPTAAPSVLPHPIPIPQ